EFLGRNDDQVKIRGFRIELEEITTVLEEQEDVREAVVVARDDGDGGRRLGGDGVGHEGGGAPNIADLRIHLRRKLPEYMVPHVFVVLENIPLLPNGKIDRKNLPEPLAQLDSASGTVEPFRNEVEAILGGIFAEELKLNRVD